FVLCLLVIFLPLSVHCAARHLDLHSFPTRRSSDLRPEAPAVQPRRAGAGPHGAGGQGRAVDGAEAGADRAGSCGGGRVRRARRSDRKSTRLNSSHVKISYAVFCLKKKKKRRRTYVE